jgi:hypothetical protein
LVLKIAGEDVDVKKIRQCLNVLILWIQNIAEVKLFSSSSVAAHSISLKLPVVSMTNVSEFHAMPVPVLLRVNGRNPKWL